MYTHTRTHVCTYIYLYTYTRMCTRLGRPGGASRYRDQRTLKKRGGGAAVL